MKKQKILLLLFLLPLIALAAVVSCDTMPQNSVDSTVEIVTQNNDSSDGASGDTSSPLFIWKGFSHKWLRTVMGFSIPHRVACQHWPGHARRHADDKDRTHDPLINRLRRRE